MNKGSKSHAYTCLGPVSLAFRIITMSWTGQLKIRMKYHFNKKIFVGRGEDVPGLSNTPWKWKVATCINLQYDQEFWNSGEYMNCDLNSIWIPTL